MRYRCSVRNKASANGEKVYNTGKPCMHGHLSDRLTASGRCVECHNAGRRKESKPRKHEMTGISAQALEEKMRHLPSDVIPGGKVFFMGKQVNK